MSEPKKKPPPSKRAPPPPKGSILKRIFVILFLLVLGWVGYQSWDYYQKTGEVPWKDPERTLAFAKRKLGLARDRIEESLVLLEEQSSAIENWFEDQEVREWFNGEKIKPAETWDEMLQVASAYVPFAGGEGKPRRKVSPSERVDADAADRLAAEEASRQAAYEARRTARLDAAAAARRRQLEARNPRPPEPSPAPAPVEPVPVPEELPAVPTEPPPLPLISEPPPRPEPVRVAEAPPEPPPARGGSSVAVVEVEEIEVEEAPAAEPVEAAPPDELTPCKQWMGQGSRHIRAAYELTAGPKKQKEILAARALFLRARAKLEALYRRQPRNGKIQRMLVDCNSGIWFCNKNITL